MKTPLHHTLDNLELLLQTSCSDEQCGLPVNARFGAIQLLETINEILQYSSISSESDAKPEATSEADIILDKKEPPQIVGPRGEHIAGAASTVDLVRLCEGVVKDTTRRMRLLETIMSPSEQQDQEQGKTRPRQEPALLRKIRCRSWVDKHDNSLCKRHSQAGPTEQEQEQEITGLRS
jgi:hypothetical protein